MNAPRSLALSFAVASLFASTSTQAQDVIVPATHASTEGSGGLMIPGLGTDGRQQLLLDGVHLTGLQGRALRGLSFRRDLGDGSVMGGADIDLVVRLAPAARAVDAPATDFSANLGAGVVEVFRGRVHVPQSGSPATGIVPWAAPYTIDVPFQVDYAYAGGDLVVDVEGAPVGVPDFHWVADQATSIAEGTVRVFGHGCGPHSPVLGTNSGIAPRELVPGQVATFGLFGEPGALAILGIGLAPRSSALDLTILGAPGCGLFVDPAMTATTVVSQPVHAAFAVGHAEVRIPLPGDNALYNARFAAQWFEFGATLHTYHGLDCTMAGSNGGLGISTVAQETGHAVRVSLNSAPALRFGVR